jgi:exonuclease SbcD
VNLKELLIILILKVIKMTDTKFIVTGDLHWTGRNPKARKDHYTNAIVEKIIEIFELAKKNKCKGIIIPGDIFDSPGISLSLISQLGTLLKKCKTAIFCIPGNHDLYNGNLNSMSRTPYGLFLSFNLINNLQERVFPGLGGLVLQGHGFNSDITDKNIKYYLPHESDFYDQEPQTKILITHGMLLDKSPGYELRHTLISEVAEHPEAPDILINGHEHEGFGIKKMNSTLLINPGSIGRIKASEANIQRKPKVALLTIPEEGEPEAELIELESAKPGHEVLSREHIEKEKRRKEMTKEFLGLLAEEGDNNYLELESIMENIAKKEEISGRVVEEAMVRVENAREVMDHGKRTAG